MAVKKVTIVKKGSVYSIHGSFKTVCQMYGWNHADLTQKNRGVPDSVDGCQIIKVPMEVSMYSLAVLSIVLAPDSERFHYSDDDHSDGWIKKVFSTDEGEVDIKVTFDIKHSGGGDEPDYSDFSNMTITECLLRSSDLPNEIDVELCDYTSEFILKNINWNL